VRVRKEEIIERKSDPVPHHLALGALAAVDQKRLAFTNDGKGTDRALDGGSRGGGSEKTY